MTRRCVRLDALIPLEINAFKQKQGKKKLMRIVQKRNFGILSNHMFNSQFVLESSKNEQNWFALFILGIWNCPEEMVAINLTKSCVSETSLVAKKYVYDARSCCHFAFRYTDVPINNVTCVVVASHYTSVCYIHRKYADMTTPVKKF